MNRSSWNPLTVIAEPQDGTVVSRTLLDTIRRRLPDDVHSQSQYSRGLVYFRHRLERIGFTGDTLLDLGCGAGNWSLAAAPLFNRVVGIDSSEARLSAAAEGARYLGYRNVLFLQGSAWSIPIAESAATHVLCVNAFQYFRRDRHRVVVRELTRCTACGARAYMTTTCAGYAVGQSLDGLRRWRVAQVLEGARALVWGAASLVVPRLAPRYLRKSELPSIVAGGGWSLEGDGLEGASAPDVEPLYPPMSLGFASMREYQFHRCQL